MRIGINGSGQLANPDIDKIVADVERSERDGFTSYWLAQTALADSLAMLAIAVSVRTRLATEKALCRKRLRMSPAVLNSAA